MKCPHCHNVLEDEPKVTTAHEYEAVHDKPNQEQCHEKILREREPDADQGITEDQCSSCTATQARFTDKGIRKIKKWKCKNCGEPVLAKVDPTE